MIEATMVHELALKVGTDYAAVVKRLAEEIVTMPPGTKLVLRYERQVRLDEPLSAAANRLSASTVPTPHGKGTPKWKESKPALSAPEPAAPVRAPIRVVPAPAPALKRDPPIPERPPDNDEPTFTRTPLRERMKARRQAEAAT